MENLYPMIIPTLLKAVPRVYPHRLASCACLKQTIASASMTSFETPTDALPGKAEDELCDANLKRVCECAACTPPLQVFS
jgi:hypothetical protein